MIFIRGFGVESCFRSVVHLLVDESQVGHEFAVRRLPTSCGSLKRA
jgi:hypothetical protein